MSEKSWEQSIGGMADGSRLRYVARHVPLQLNDGTVGDLLIYIQYDVKLSLARFVLYMYIYERTITHNDARVEINIGSIV